MQGSDFRQWIGRTESREDHVTATPIAALAATLDRDDPLPNRGDPLPPLWHWLFFLPLARQSELGRDGHPARGAFLPPVPLPRRMWAGGRLRFLQPLRVGERIERTSRIVDVTTKEGRSGSLVFVVVRHEIAGERGAAIVEEHDIVYRDAPDAGSATPPAARAPADAVWTRTLVPALRHRSRGLSRARRAWAFDRHAARRSPAPPSTGCDDRRVRVSRPQPAVRRYAVHSQRTRR